MTFGFKVIPKDQRYLTCCQELGSENVTANIIDKLNYENTLLHFVCEMSQILILLTNTLRKHTFAFCLCALDSGESYKTLKVNNTKLFRMGRHCVSAENLARVS